MSLFVRWCAKCGRAWPVAGSYWRKPSGCPNCGERGETRDAFALIAELAGGNVRLEDEAEADQGMRETKG